MGHAATRSLTWSAALRLGRVSNLPTVWTNVAAGIVLAGGEPDRAWTAALLLAVSLSYVAGMYLNDWFDRDIDARERPERPIPAGQVRPGTVLAAGLAMLAAGTLLIGWTGLAAGTGWGAAGAGAALAATILFYDWRHKGNPLGPLVMGLCRMLVYVAAGLALTGALPGELLAAAAALLCYLIGLTYAARQESSGRIGSLWPLLFLAVPFVHGMALALTGPVAAVLYLLFLGWVAWSLSFLLVPARVHVPRAVVSLIAGISLFDGLLAAGHGAPGTALACIAAFLATLALQRRVPGT